MSKRKPRVDRLEVWALDRLKPDPRNTRLHPDDARREMRKSLERYGQTWPLLIQPNGTIIAGHMRLGEMTALGWSDAKVLIADGWTPAMIQAYLVADNSIPLLSEWDEVKLAAQIREMLEGGETADDLALGFTQEQIDNLLNPPKNTGVSGSLAARFGVAPFTVLNAREGWWQNRKDLWIALGIRSELGRGDVPPGGSGKTAAYRQRGRAKDKPAAGGDKYGELL